MTAKVSILIPVYNREDLISECIQSALDQTFLDFEVIVVDNKSEDRTFEICQDFAKRDPRVKVFQNDTNIGPVRNWQACADKATGEFCKILFSDDVLMSTCLEKMVPRLADPDIAFVFCSALIGETLDKSIVAYDLGGVNDLASEDYVKHVLRSKVPVSPGAVLLRTEDLKRNLKTDFPTAIRQPFAQHGAGPDVMIMLLTSLNYQRIAHIRDKVVFFRAHQGSFSVADAGGLIQEGYEKAFCYFLRKNTGGKSWIEYVSRIWLKRMKKQKRFVGLRSFILEHEGTGQTSEIFLAIIFAACNSFSFLRSRIGTKILHPLK